MWELTIRNLIERKRQMALTAIAVLLGVAFIGATQILGATVSRSLTTSAGDFSARLAADVRGEEIGQLDERAAVPASLADELRSLDGVDDVLGLYLEPVIMVTSEDKVMPLPVTAGTWFDGPAQPLEVTEGTAPAAAGEVALTESLAEDAGYALGDTVRFESRLGAASAVVTALVTTDGSSVAGVPSLVLDAGAGALLLPDGEVTQLGVLGDGLDVERVREVVDATATGSGLDVRSGEQAAEDAIDDAEASATAISTTFTVFGSVSLFVGVFIIYNTFNILMAQRRREMALLRAIGVRRRQVVRSVLAEAAAIGLVAGALGAGVGVLIAVLGRSLLLADIEGALVISPAGLLSGVLIGVVTTVCSAWMPARRAAKVAPVEALRDASTGGSYRSRPRLIGGLVLAVLCALLVVAGLAPEAESPAATIGAAAFVGLIALLVLSPMLATALVSVFGAPVRLLRGQVGELATQNAKRQPQRTAATANALLLGVAIVGFALVVASSLSASVSTAFEDRVDAEYVIAPIAFGTSLSPEAISAAQDAAGDVATSVSWSVPGEVDGDDTTLLALDTTVAGELWDFRPEGAALAELGSDGVLVDRHAAEDEGWALGDTVAVTFPGDQARTFTVRAIGETRAFGSDLVIDDADVSLLAPTALATQVLVGEDAARGTLDEALTGFPNAEVTTPAEMVGQVNEAISLLLQVLFGFLGLSVIIAFIGVANTLALSIHERTRELGILRAIALRRSHVRATVRWEAAIIAALGTALGIVFGAAFGAALARALEETGFAQLSIPWLQLVLVILAASAAGALAAVLPARRAAKLDILDAIHQL